MIIQKDKLVELDLLTPQDLVTLHRRQQHVGQTETRCFDLSGHGVTLPARLSFTYSSFIELHTLLFNQGRHGGHITGMLLCQGRHGEFEPDKVQYSTQNFFDRLCLIRTY